MNATKRNRWGIALALAAAGALCAQAAAAAPKKLAQPQPRPAAHAAKKAATPVARKVPLPRKRPLPAAARSALAQASVGARAAPSARRATTTTPIVRPVSGPFAVAASRATAPDDIAAVKQVIAAARKGKDADANAAEQSIRDPVARKLAEWVILRDNSTHPTFQRYAAFVNANPSWPHARLFRRRAENALWNDGGRRRHGACVFRRP